MYDNSAWRDKSWHDMTDEEKVGAIIERVDGTRLDNEGGYPSDYLIDNGKVYWADPTGYMNKAVELSVRPLAEFIAAYEEDMLEDEDEGDQE